MDLDPWTDHCSPQQDSSSGVASESSRKEYLSYGQTSRGCNSKFRGYYHPHLAMFSPSILRRWNFMWSPWNKSMNRKHWNLLAQQESRWISWLSSFPITGSLWTQGAFSTGRELQRIEIPPWPRWWCCPQHLSLLHSVLSWMPVTR